METDTELLNAVRMMNEDALVKIFDLYATPLYNYALRLCGDSLMADDIVGDVFVKLLEQLSAGHGPKSNLRSYLYETAYHLIIDEARDSRHSAPFEAAAFLRQDTHSIALSLEDQILFKQILNAIQHDLTADQRHVIILRFLEEFSLRETAAILGKSVSHIKVIQSRGLAKLRRAYQHNEAKPAPLLPRIEKQSEALSIS